MNTKLLRLASRKLLHRKPDATWLWRSGRKRAIIVRNKRGWQLLLAERHGEHTYVLAQNAREAHSRARAFLDGVEMEKAA